ncbi:MAG: recombinase family protein [Bacillota bacterium]
MLTPQEIHPSKVAVYIRWSTDDQGEGTTLETQRERCCHFLLSQGWQFREELVYIDEGFSGGTLERPALSRLRSDVAAGRIDCVVVYKIDRLSRSVVDMVDLVLREWEGRCFVRSASEEINTITPAGKIFFYLLVSFAEYERNLIRERTMGGKVKRAEQGLNPGFRPPYGYRRGRQAGRLEVVPEEAGLVRRVFDLYRQGNGTQQIAQLLNQNSPRRGRPWSRLAIRRMLANPAYVGVLEYGRTRRTTREQRERQGLGRVVRYQRPRFARVEAAFPAIVERAVWEEVQRLLQARSGRGPHRPTYSDYLLSGLARCRCGATVGGKGVGGRRYYYCTGRRRHGAGSCSAGHLPAEPVDSALAAQVRALLAERLRAEDPAALAELLRAALQERIREAEAERRRTEQELSAGAQRRRRAEEDYRSGSLPARLYARELEALEAAEGGLRARLAQLRAWQKALQRARLDPRRLCLPTDFTALWERLTVPERKELLRRLTLRIQLYRPVRSQEPPHLEVEWNPDPEISRPHLEALLRQAALRTALAGLREPTAPEPSS